VTVGINYGTALQGIQKGYCTRQTFLCICRYYMAENDVCFRINVMMIVRKSYVHPANE
jgi:hypothetical protein